MESKQLVNVLSWNAYGVWVYDAKVDTCAICRSSLNERCLSCNSVVSRSLNIASDCPVTTKLIF